MRKIFTLGETVLDILFKNNVPINAIPGGSMLNTSVSLGRLKKPVYFISEFGQDLPGKLIKEFLEKNNVNSDYIYLYKEGHTILALAFLDEHNDGEYNFYKIYPSVRFDIKFPEPEKNDIFLFGSFLSIDKGIRDKIKDFVRNLKEKGVLIVYDPNFRKPHLKELEELLPLIKENIGFADILKGSHEDFQLIFNAHKPDEVYDIISSYGCKNLIITAGSGDVTVKTVNFTKKYSVKEIEIKSTVGAGDTFNAGILYGLFVYNIVKEDLDELDINIWDEIIGISIQFAGEVCQSYENYISGDR